LTDERLSTAKRLLKVRLAPVSETAIQVTVFALLPNDQTVRLELGENDPSSAAVLVRDLVLLQPGLSIERVYSRWDGQHMRPWPESLWRDTARAFQENDLVPVPVEVMPDDADPF
jgi:hypothetical protein